MIIIFLLYVIVCLYGVKLHPRFNQDYLSIDSTQAVKGIFIFLVFFRHFNTYVTFEHPLDRFYIDIDAWLGQSLVTLFLFYSGYGVMESINKKGLGYLKQFPVKRILSTLFKFACAVFIFFLIATFITRKNYPLSTVLLSFIGWKSLGNSNWYIFVILVLYTITYLSFRFLLQRNRILPLTIIFAVLAALIVLNVHFRIKSYYWMDTALCYVAGMFYAQYRKVLEPLINKNNLVYCAITLSGLLILAFFMKPAEQIWSLIGLNLCFACVVVLLTMRITFKNKLIIWCGKNLFELYILQRIPMIIFQHLGLASYNVYLYFGLCLIATVMLVWPFQYCTDKLWNAILKVPSFLKHKS